MSGFGGKFESLSSDLLEYSRYCCIPYMGISGCRPRVTKSRPFLIPSSMSYFRLWNSSFGRCKISQFGYYLGRDLHIFRIWDKILEVSALFLSRYCWLCYGISFQWSAEGILLKQGLVFQKKYFTSACSISSNCQFAAWAHWVVLAKSYNIERSNDT